MTSQRDFLQKLVELLDTCEIPYMLSGSVCSSFHGQPRATNDADIVIAPIKKQLLHFLSLLGPDYYVSQEAAIEALKNNSMFNVIHVQAGWKADLIIRKERDYSRQEFGRRKKTVVMGINVCVVSAEDSILSKLEWSKDSESKSQCDDAAGVLLVQGERLDFDYLKKWARELKIEDLLEQLLKKVEKLK